jgi:hypothetical protein
MGTSSFVYVSIPDTTSTCANLGLPSLPQGYSYRCVTSSTLQKTDGTGWIPVNLSSLSTGSPLPKFPVDPINTTSSGEYYTYTPGGSWHLTAVLSSEKYKMGGSDDKVSKDGGSYTELYEIGSDLKLLPITRGDKNLLGYWTFDEASGTTVYDRSGNGNDGTMYSSSTATDLHTSSGCKVGPRCGNFDGVDDFVELSRNVDITQDLTITAWIKKTGSNDDAVIFSRGYFSCDTWRTWSPYTFVTGNSPVTGTLMLGYLFSRTNDCSGGSHWKRHYMLDQPSAPFTVFHRTGPANYFNHDEFVHSAIVVKTLPSTNRSVYFYVNGVSQGVYNENTSAGDEVPTTSLMRTRIGGCYDQVPNSWCGGVFKFFGGTLDDVRIYNRALSDTEIRAIYEATK